MKANKYAIDAPSSLANNGVVKSDKLWKMSSAVRLLPLLLLLVLPAVVKAQFTFTTNTDGSLNIYQYTGTNNVVIIPDTTNGLSITSIGDYAFEFCTNLTSVTIPTNISTIGRATFYGCTDLNSVTMPDNVNRIGGIAFGHCASLTNIIIPSSITSIAGDVFEYCSSLRNIVIPSSVNNIGAFAFLYCTSLTNVTIGSGVTDIGLQSFYNCSDLTSVTIPSGVVIIEDEAFRFCGGLTNVTIPSSVTSIGEYAFDSCGSLIAITVDQQNTNYSSSDGVLFDKDQTTLIQFPGGKEGEYIIPQNVTSIGDVAFEYCSSLTSVIIPNSVTNIGSYNFQFCSSLTNVFFAGNAPDYGEQIFFDAYPVTVYYLSGTTGWNSGFDGLSTVLWNAQAQTKDGYFGVQNNQFGFNITGTTNIPIVVEVSSNLASGIWTPLQTCTITNGSIYFSDPTWTNHPKGFYRISSP